MDPSTRCPVLNWPASLLRQLPSFLLLLPHLPPPSRIFVTALLFLVLRNYMGNLMMATMLIDGDEGQVGRSHMASGPGDVVFHPAFHAHFHRRVESAVDR